MLDAQKDLTVLASECTVSGRVSGRDLDVLGRFEGELELSGRVHVAAGGKVKGRVRATVVQIDGQFEGEVRTGTLRLGVNATARGRFFADRLSIVDGARLEGDVNLAEPSLSAKADPSASGRIVQTAGVGEPGPELVARA